MESSLRGKIDSVWRWGAAEVGGLEETPQILARAT